MHWPPLSPGNIPGTHFCYRLGWPLGHGVAGRIKLMKNPKDPIKKWTHNLLACSTVPQPCQHIPQIPGNYLFTIYLKMPTVTPITENCMIGWKCIMNCKKACIQSIMPHSQYHLLCLCLEELKDGKKKNPGQDEWFQGQN